MPAPTIMAGWPRHMQRPHGTQHPPSKRKISRAVAKRRGLTRYFTDKPRCEWEAYLAELGTAEEVASRPRRGATSI
jgi:hypothetical protein